MVVRALLSKDKGNTIYRVIDASKQGYMTSPTILVEGDRNVVYQRYKLAEVVGFEAVGKGKMMLYIKQ